MCLDKIGNFAVPQDYGWQIFRKEKGCLYPYYFGEGPVPVGKWQRDKFRIFDRHIDIDLLNLKYKKGYHIFLNKEDAEAYCSDSSDCYCVKKVRFKRIVAQGFQMVASKGISRLVKVVVCHKRFVESD